MLETLDELEKSARDAVSSVEDTESLNRLKIDYLGKKGKITLLLRGLGQLPPGERPLLGQKANHLRNTLEELFARRELQIEEEGRSLRWESERLDITLPGKPFVFGHKHPITRVQEEIIDILNGLGFQVAEGPEVESDYYNFEALNFLPDHPARDMQDSFYFSPNLLLRTHTSPVQVRVMEKLAPELPVRIIAPGKVYRRDDDATHLPMFQQVEGLAVDRGITFAHLKGVLLLFLQEMFGARKKMRLRPSFFPFTEPSAEVDISCVVCGGNGCRVCKQTGWLEILGAGMVHPRVLEVSGYNPREVTGFAFGMGVERVAMLKLGVDDLRHFYANDLRVLRQF